MGKLITKIKTNSTPDSVFHVRHDPVKFAALWANYPDYKPYTDPKTGEPPQGYSNQCAIKLSVSLHRSGVEMKSYKGKSLILIDGKKTAALADDLASWLKFKPFCGCNNTEEYTGKNVFEKINDRTGIVYLANYWERKPGERSGDHIDLWNGSRMTEYSSWLRVHFGFAWDGVWSDYKRATEVLFWNIL